MTMSLTYSATMRKTRHRKTSRITLCNENDLDKSIRNITKNLPECLKPITNSLELNPDLKLYDLGQINSIYNKNNNFALIYSQMNTNKALKKGTPLFDDDGDFVGQIVEILGNSTCPMYVMQIGDEVEDRTGLMHQFVYFQLGANSSQLTSVYDDDDDDDEINGREEK
ncbi:MAG: hypothetical protein MHMPM18_001977 [Marteilia pararefringens]